MNSERDRESTCDGEIFIHLVTYKCGMRRRRLLQYTGSAGIVFAGTLSGISSVTAAPPKPKIETSFAPPSPYISGISVRDDQLWIAEGESGGEGGVNIISKDGIVQESFSPLNGKSDHRITGAALGKENMQLFGYIFSNENGLDFPGHWFKLNEDLSNITRSIELNTSWLFPLDAAYVDSYVWISDRDRIHQLDSAGNIRQSIIPDINETPFGLAYDGSFFWGAGPNHLFKFSMEGEIKSRFSYPRGAGGWELDQQPPPLSLAHDGELLWLGRRDKGNIVGLDTDIQSQTPTPTSTTQQSGNEGSGAQQSTPQDDKDGDGVPDEDDYAPNDPDVQSKDDIVGATSDSVPGFDIISGVAGVGAISSYIYMKMSKDE